MPDDTETTTDAEAILAAEAFEAGEKEGSTDDSGVEEADHGSEPEPSDNA